MGGYFVVEARGRKGGLALLWNSEIMVEIVIYSCFHINSMVGCEVRDLSWQFTSFYGHPEAGRRNDSWKLLSMLNPSA